MYKKLYFILFLFFVWIPIQAQTEIESKSDTLQVEPDPIPINEITSTTEALSTRFVKLKDLIKPSTLLQTVDTVLHNSEVEITSAQTQLYGDSSEQTYRELQNLLRLWQGYEGNLSSVQERLTKRSDEIQEVIDELNDYLKVWFKTKEKGTENGASKEVMESIDDVIENINSILLMSTMRSDSVFMVQKKLTDQALIIDEVIHEIKTRQKNLQKSYFVLDRPPIWEEFSSFSSPAAILGAVKEAIKSDFKSLWSFFKSERTNLMYQIIFLVLLFIMMFYLKRKWFRTDADKPINGDKAALVFINHPLATVLSVGLLISFFFYKNPPPALAEYTSILLLTSAVYLLPKIVVKRLRFTLFMVLVLLLISMFINYVGIGSIEGRLAQLFSFLVLGYALIEFRKNKTIQNHFAGQRNRILTITLSVFTVLTWLGVIATLIGSTNLADFILGGVLYSTVFAILTWLAIEIFASLIELLVKEDPQISVSSLSNLRLLIQKRMRGLLIFFGIVFWVYTTFISFGVIKYVVELVTDFMEVNWQLGEVTISMGGIISFALIIVVTLIILRVIKTLFSEEWLEYTNISKSSSGGISMVLRIVVFTIGFYLAASAAGINFSQLGFIFGALSVGIGFGLQNVVLNFIAGLILAFERPIHIGDTIEVDMEFGVVSEIGIRASKIKKFSGSEVIIPNGDLISKKVINFTLSDEKRRFKVPFRTSIDAEPRKVMALLTQVASGHENTLKEPAPKTYFAGYGDTSLDFFLYFWTEFSTGLSTQSEVIIRAHEALKEAGIEVPIPLRKIKSQANNTPEHPAEHLPLD